MLEKVRLRSTETTSRHTAKPWLTCGILPRVTSRDLNPDQRRSESPLPDNPQEKRLRATTHQSGPIRWPTVSPGLPSPAPNLNPASAVGWPAGAAVRFPGRLGRLLLLPGVVRIHVPDPPLEIAAREASPAVGLVGDIEDDLRSCLLGASEDGVGIIHNQVHAPSFGAANFVRLPCQVPVL